jgi:hypothetical protein
MNGQTNSLTSRRARKPCAGWRARRSPRKSLSPPLRHSSGYDSRRNCLTLWTHGLMGLDTHSGRAVALMVLCCDPLAIALTAAASARH